MGRLSLERINQCNIATQNAKNVLVKGDRIRASRCGGIKATYTFVGWDGNWIITKSGIDDIAAIHVYKLNGEPINFWVSVFYD